jgi:hypothetical protein
MALGRPGIGPVSRPAPAVLPELPSKIDLRVRRARERRESRRDSRAPIPR